MSLKTKGRESEWDVGTNEGVTQTHMSRHTPNKQKHIQGLGINSVQLRTWRTAHTAAHINADVQAVAALVTTAIIICKFTVWRAVRHFD